MLFDSDLCSEKPDFTKNLLKILIKKITIKAPGTAQIVDTMFSNISIGICRILNSSNVNWFSGSEGSGRRARGKMNKICQSPFSTNIKTTFYTRTWFNDHKSEIFKGGLCFQNEPQRPNAHVLRTRFSLFPCVTQIKTNVNREVVKKRSFYGQADRKGGGGQPPRPWPYKQMWKFWSNFPLYKIVR